MPIRVHVSPGLRHLAGSQEVVLVEGSTIRECLDDFKRQFPDSSRWFDLSNPQAWIEFKNKIVGFDELDKDIGSGDELKLILIFAGG